MYNLCIYSSFLLTNFAAFPSLFLLLKYQACSFFVKKIIFEALLSKYGVFTVTAATNFLSYQKKLIVAATEVLKFDQQLSHSYCNFATLDGILIT